jgi:DNA-binding transcriptional MerR regulator
VRVRSSAWDGVGRANGQRRYGADILHKLGVIHIAQQAGLAIAEIQTRLSDFPVSTPPSARWQALVSQKLAEIDVLIERAHAMKACWNKHCNVSVWNRMNVFASRKAQRQVHSILKPPAGRLPKHTSEAATPR